MRKVFLFIAVCLAFSSLVGCDGKKKTDGDNAPTLVDSNAAADSTLYGICGEGTSMSVLELITDKGDTHFCWRVQTPAAMCREDCLPATIWL